VPAKGDGGFRSHGGSRDHRAALDATLAIIGSGSRTDLPAFHQFLLEVPPLCFCFCTREKRQKAAPHKMPRKLPQTTDSAPEPKAMWRSMVKSDAHGSGTTHTDQPISRFAGLPCPKPALTSSWRCDRQRLNSPVIASDLIDSGQNACGASVRASRKGGPAKVIHSAVTGHTNSMMR